MRRAINNRGARVGRLGLLAAGLIVASGALRAEEALDGMDVDGTSDPVAPAGAGAQAGASWFYIQWGNTNYADAENGDALTSPYEPTPSWALRAYRENGQWRVGASAFAWHVVSDDTNAECSLNVDLDRALLDRALRGTNALYYALSFFEHTNAASSLFLDLVNTNSETVLTNLTGRSLNARGGDSTAVLLSLPFRDYPQAACLHLRAAGPATVFESLLFIEEADGLAGNDYEIERWSVGGYGFDLAAADANVPNHAGVPVPETDAAATNRSSSWSDAASTNRAPRWSPSTDSDRAAKTEAKTIYVDQARGDDRNTGKAVADAGPGLNGPKRTIRGGVNAVRPSTEKLVIREGEYGESADLRGRKLKVVIEGRVRL